MPTLQQLEATPWAKAFRLDSPVSYPEALKFAMEPNLEVLLEKTDANGEPAWAIRVFDAPDFWMDALPTKREAQGLCREMGWRIK